MEQPRSKGLCPRWAATSLIRWLDICRQVCGHCNSLSSEQSLIEIKGNGIWSAGSPGQSNKFLVSPIIVSNQVKTAGADSSRLALRSTRSLVILLDFSDFASIRVRS